MPTCLFAGPISPLCTRKKNSTAKVFNSNFISSAAARKLTQQPLESKVTLGSPLTVLYANRPAPGQWSRPAESLLMQIWLSESILLERVRRPPTPQVIFHRIACLHVPEEGEWRRESRGKTGCWPFQQWRIVGLMNTSFSRLDSTLLGFIASGGRWSVNDTGPL